jgi:hypothetical protein
MGVEHEKKVVYNNCRDHYAVLMAASVIYIAVDSMTPARSADEIDNLKKQHRKYRKRAKYSRQSTRWI